ncbi:MAG: transglutaminaseTgpA domain-containing protein [Gaiellaceae bacterium]
MGRTAVAYSLPAALVALAWLRLEDPRAGADGFWIVLLALAPALLPTLAARLVAVPWVALVAVWIAFGSPESDGGPRRGFFAPALESFEDGFAGYYDTRVPFSAVESPAMHGILVLAIFGFCVLLGLAIASRRPLPAVLLVLAGAGWPATLLPADGPAYGALILTAALWLLASLRLTRPTPSLAAGLVVIVAAIGLSSSAAIAKDGVLAWERWDPYRTSGDPVGVDYVWDANYGGIDFPDKPTVVLRVRAPQRSLYWRATTLDQFTQDRWIENLAPLSAGIATGPLARDPLLPRAAFDSANWTKQSVEVVGLADDHLVAAAAPMLYEAASLGRALFLSGGVVRLQRPLQRGQFYDVYSYAPLPKPAELARARPVYPKLLDRYLEIGRTRVAPFGTPGRADDVAALFEDERQLAIWDYEGLYRQAARLARGATGPYGAAVAIEAWLRTTGGFTYDERPPPPAEGVPALAHFVDSGRRGYCQQFAGSMALMLRFLGIPARVAAGFTSGKYRNGVWTVTDHNAHAWVEVWFPRFGWLSFDPTPGRGELAAEYSSSSPTFNPGDAAGIAFGNGRGAGGLDPGGARELDRLDALRERQGRRRSVSPPGGVNTIWILLAVVLCAGAAVGLAKLAWRRSRYLTRDPRRLAGAARRELADFLVDQGVVVGASATGEELRELVRSEFGVDGRLFAQALGEARFGPPAVTVAAATRSRRELHLLLRRIRRGLTRAQRLRGFVALRSLRA